jgi:hypothetical protein
MKDCTVSIIGQDGQTYSLDVTASSLFDVVDQAVKSWAKLWWYEPNGGGEAGGRIYRSTNSRQTRQEKKSARCGPAPFRGITQGGSPNWTSTGHPVYNCP